MSRLDLIEHLRHGGPRIAPSMLACDFAHLADEVRALQQAGAEILHLDVMDGHFVPNLTYGPVVVESLRNATKLPLDAHLMISQPENYLDHFITAGCDIITVHVEAITDPKPVLHRIREADVVAGVSLNPSTPVQSLAGCLAECDLVLVMSVQPGFGGQTFQDTALEKLRRLRVDRPDLLLEVDGGIKRHNVGAVAQAGADLLVAGTAVFHAPDYTQELEALTSLAKAGKAMK